MFPRLLPLIAAIAFPAIADDGLELFEKQIRPVLAAKCYGCHGAETKEPMGGLRVDTREGLLRGGKSGVPAIRAGKPEESLLIKAIQHSSKDLKMPPGPPLPKETIAAFTEWVKIGAPDPRTGDAGAVASKPAYDWDKERKHWAYQPVRDSRPQASIDDFVRERLAAKGLRRVGPASKLAMIRRVTYTLTGLPPAPAEVDAFLADGSANALEKVVDRLLDSPAYGEHWGRHWLDIARYADTAGDASDFPVPEMFRYRNYVIRAFQADKPYDQFLREQLAGDTMPFRDSEDRREKLTATGYLANARRFGQTMGEFHLTVDDAIDNLGKAVLGLTVGCARCHDHKFDPIPTSDYYALAGIFQSTNFSHPGLEHHQYLEHFQAVNETDSARLSRAQQRMVENYRVVKGGAKLKESKDPLERLKYFEASSELETLRRTWPDVPMIYSVNEGDPKTAKVLIKGDPSMPGAEAPRGFLSILGGQKLPADYKGSGRALLADWITDPKNPLTARVMVNRVWMWHFGRGLVNSPSDFGARGEAPTHPELLDHLAARFVADGWSIKKLHRRILLSNAYATASGHDAANAVKDPKNESYWRFDRRRLSAEEIRDSMLTAAGDLDPVPAGAHPFPPRASYTFTQHRPFVGDIDKFDNAKRSVYLLQQRIRRHPFLDLFDGADTNATTAGRAENTTAVQALFFMNNDFVFQRAESLAAKVAWTGASNAERLRGAYRRIFGRSPTAAETARAETFLTASRGTIAGAGIAKDDTGRAAWTALIRTLFATNEFLYVD